MSSSRVPAARNALQILSLLSRIDAPISAARIRSELGLPRSTTYHLLNELIDAGFVVRLPEHQTYGLGLAAYSMASAYTTQQPLVRMVNRPLVEVARRVSGSGHLSRLVGAEVVYLLEIRAPGAVSLITDVGVHLPALQTASGRVMLAHLPEVEARAVLAMSSSPTDVGDLREELARIRQRGWAYERGEITPGQASIATPIVDHLQRPAAALTVTFPSSVSVQQREETCQDLQKLTGWISKSIFGSN